MEKNKKIILIVSLLVLTAVGGYLIYRVVKKDKGGVTAETKKNRITFTR